MARFLKKNRSVVGKSPDDLVFVGKKKLEKPVIRVMEFTADTLQEYELEDPADCHCCDYTDKVCWISVYGLHDTSVVQALGDAFGIHSLALEDILNTGQRPRLEDYDTSLFLVLKILGFDQQEETVHSDQLSLIVSTNCLISFHEEPVNIFQPLRERIKKKKGRIRRSGVDYLAYGVLDLVVDHYMLTIEELGSRIEDIEERVLWEPDQDVLNQITRYKQEVNYLRKTIRPARELLVRLVKDDSDLISEESLPFYRDLQGHLVQATEVLESYREMLSDHLNTYNTSISNKLNEIMKVLTIFAAIFIPLTFIAGIYGTNFEYLPELRYKYSYFIFWAVLLTVAAVMVRYFRRKGWM